MDQVHAGDAGTYDDRIKLRPDAIPHNTSSLFPARPLRAGAIPDICADLKSAVKLLEPSFHGMKLTPADGFQTCDGTQ
jgi:hypothetical protein